MHHCVRIVHGLSPGTDCYMFGLGIIEEHLNPAVMAEAKWIVLKLPSIK